MQLIAMQLIYDHPWLDTRHNDRNWGFFDSLDSQKKTFVYRFRILGCCIFIGFARHQIQRFPAENQFLCLLGFISNFWLDSSLQYLLKFEPNSLGQTP